MNIRKYIPIGLSLFSAAIFLDSLRFKFTDAPETQTIFGKLDVWATGFGADGVFDKTGIFSQYVIGSAELVAAILLLLGLLSRFVKFRRAGQPHRAGRDDGCGQLSPVHAAGHRSQQ